MSGYEITYTFTLAIELADGSRVTVQRTVHSDSFTHALSALESWAKSEGSRILAVNGLREGANVAKVA